MKLNFNKDFLRDNSQAVYSLVLMIVIPLAVVLNTVLFANYFEDAINQSLYSKATSLASAVNVGLYDKLTNPTALQQAIEAYIKNDEDITSMDLLSSANGQFTTIASSNKSNLNKTTSATVYNLAWNKDWPTAQKLLDINPTTGKERAVWLVVAPLKNSAGEKQLLLSMKVSTSLMDTLTANILSKSFWILVATILVICLLLVANSRLFEYSILYNKIKEVDNMKDEFISMASHELKTPITVIGGYASLILEDKTGQMQVSAKARECLTMMNDSTHRLKDLVEDLLNVSRIDQGRLKIETKPQDASALVSAVVKELQVQALEKNLTLTLTKPSGTLPKLNLDKDKFTQVLINLVGNAIKYTPSGTVTVSLENATEKIIIRIKDSGIGMSASEREHLFEKFYRVKNEKTAVIQGTGLGLWITKQIVELMNGKITIDSMENVGTQVSLEFPIAK